MANWLFKEEPTHYSFDDLEKDGLAVWDGVTNNLARLNLRKVKQKDRIFYYHTGKEKAVVAEMEAVTDAMPDPSGTDAKAVVVKVRPVRRLQHPVPLSRIKSDPALVSWELVRLPRLSVVPVSAEQWQRVEELSKQ
jgi:predicted RNA-binding protein with PUA-like domain